MKMDDLNLMQPRTRSVTTLAVPLTIVALILAQTGLAAIWLGAHAQKWDTAADTVKDIKAAQYTQSDASKDLALVRAEIADVRRRVEVLEAARARQERQQADLLTRASRWLAGK